MNTAKILPFRRKRHPHEDAIIKTLPDVEQKLGEKIHMDGLGVNLKELLFTLYESGEITFQQLHDALPNKKQRDH